MSGYIGTQPVPQATQTRDSFTATSGQTSFATGGYTPNFLDVYLNGVKLASADYTATNGSDVVLASGAATGDILEVVAFTTFNSASSSIDDNGNATAITIDSSENVLVGKSTIGIANVGGELRADGQITGTKDGGAPLALNRKTSDGDIALFQKDGGTVGSIGVSGTRMHLLNGDTGLRFAGDTNSIFPCTTAGADSNNAIDLGASGNRFKDFYVGGGIYLGGTGSANKLDDYESGTWTPVVASWSGTLGSVSGQVGHYIKIGKLVQLFYQFNVTNLGTASGGIFITGKPFTEDNSVISYYAGLNRPRSGTSGISELDVGGDIYLYGSSLTVSLYCGSITYKST